VLVFVTSKLPADILDRGEDTIRWHAIGARCAQARGARGIRDIAVATGIPQSLSRDRDLDRAVVPCESRNSRPASACWTLDFAIGGHGNFAKTDSPSFQ
jgi:hypothetical protein